MDSTTLTVQTDSHGNRRAPYKQPLPQVKPALSCEALSSADAGTEASETGIGVLFDEAAPRSPPMQTRLDTNKELLQQIKMQCAALNAYLVRIASEPSEFAQNHLNEVLAALTVSRESSKKALAELFPGAQQKAWIARRAHSTDDKKPIRLKTLASLKKGKVRPKCSKPEEYKAGDVRVCGYCFYEFPLEEDENAKENAIFWLKCSSCSLWAHENYCGKVKERCSVCKSGSLEYSDA